MLGNIVSFSMETLAMTLRLALLLLEVAQELLLPEVHLDWK